ncbi:MAG: flavodoxin domain-containing protein [Mogibacterium sp.]|nr:flavodoxin domain-containing protein [Mogibacterium sp.]
MKNPNRTARENRRAETGDSSDTIVVCSGKYGTALQYAKWLMEMLGCDGMEYDKKNLGYVSMYKNVVYIGAVRNGDIHMLNMLWQNYNNFGLDGRNLYICGVGLGDPESRSYVDLLRRRNGCEGQDNIDFFILPGRVKKERLKLLDRSLFKDFITGGAYGMYEKDDADLIMQRAENNYDGMSKEALDPVIRRIMELN